MPTNPMEYHWPGIIAAQAIYVAARLRLPDLLASGPKTAGELAEEAGAHPRGVECLMRDLSTLGIFERTADGHYANSPFADLLRAAHPQSQRDAALFMPAPFLWRPLGEMEYSVRTGKPAFDHVFGQRFFDYLAEHADDAATFNAAMTQGVSWTTPVLLAAYDFSRFRQLVDVGGGEGALLRDILKATPGLSGILFDLPAVVARAPEVLAGELSKRCQIVGGDFFQSVPAGADAYFLKGIIHDWPDEDAARILATLRRAIPANGILLLLEHMVKPAAGPEGMVELLMLVVGGRERAEEEFRALLAASGFTLSRVIPTGLSSLLECHPVQPT